MDKRPITLEFSADKVEMLIRSIEFAIYASGSERSPKGQHQSPMQVVAYQEFLKEILETLRQSLKGV